MAAGGDRYRGVVDVVGDVVVAPVVVVAVVVVVVVVVVVAFGFFAFFGPTRTSFGIER